MRQLLPIILFALLCGCEKPITRNLIERNYEAVQHTNGIPLYMRPGFSGGVVSIRKSACEIEEAVFWYIKKGDWSVIQITWTNTSGAWMTWTPTNSP